MRPNPVRSALLLGLLLPCWIMRGQSRFEEGEFKGFTKSTTEHIINRHEGLVRAATFAGTVVDPAGAPMPGAIVEVRGPGSHERIQGTVTDRRGQFKLRHLSEGRYAFKITFNGFQSVVGHLEIARRVRRPAFKFVLQVGV